MAQSLSDVVIHTVFSTKNRNPYIPIDIETELFSYICGVCSNLESPVIQINGMSDHIHVLLKLGKTIAVSKLISEMKSNSSRWIKKKGNQFRDFEWQAGYGAFSVSRPTIEGAVKYISTQKEHHKYVSFKEEFLDMLQRAQIPYDEKYLWD